MSITDKTTGMKAFGERVRAFRNRRFWSQEKLADKSGLSQSEISKIENASFLKEPNEETIRKLAKGLEIEPEDLVRTTPVASLFGQAEILPLGTINDGPPILIYFASALTGLNDEQLMEIELLDQRVDEICRSYMRYPLVLYRPRTKTSPKDNPHVPAPEVYEIDQERVVAADLLVLAAVFPSLGAGMELQLALQSCSSVVLLRKKGQKLSRMVTGCPARMKIVEYGNLDEAASGLTTAFNELVPLVSEFRFSVTSEHSSSERGELGARIKHVRDQRGLDIEDLARMVGVGPAYIEAIESKPEQVVNPSLQILRRISRALSASEAFLITGHEIPIQHQNPIFLNHSRALDIYASETKMPVDDYKELWRRHVERYGPEFSLSGVDRRIDVGDRKYWIEKHEGLKKERAKELLPDRKLF